MTLDQLRRFLVSSAVHPKVKRSVELHIFKKRACQNMFATMREKNRMSQNLILRKILTLTFRFRNILSPSSQATCRKKKMELRDDDYTRATDRTHDCTTRHHTRPTTRCTRCHDDDVRRTQLGTHRATRGTYRKAVLVGIKKKVRRKQHYSQRQSCERNIRRTREARFGRRSRLTTHRPAVSNNLGLTR